MARIQPKLRPHREAVAALEAAGYTVEPLRFGRGDHLIVEVASGKATARLTISGSPGGLFLHNVLSQARRRLNPAG